jgi:hypothetical protein
MLSATQLRRSILILLGVALAAGRADAQTTVTYWTLEARIGEAEGVVRGPIAKVSRKVIVPPGGQTPDGTPWPDGIVEYTITVKVDEVLKGNTKDNVEFVRRTSALDTTYDEWFKARTPFLWFLARNKEAVSVSGALRLGEPVAAEATYRTGYEPPLFSMDFTVLKGATEILPRARAYARQSPKPVPTHTMTIPRDVAQRCRPSGDANFLIVPADASLEQTARRLITSPHDCVKDDKLDSHSRYQLRLAGVNALRHFKSNGNTTLLRSLLDDPTTVFETIDEGPRKGTTIKRYPVRAQSYDILTAWGVDVPRPVTEVIIPPDGGQT